MKLTISETITKEVELILPCWRSTETAYYYIDKDICIEVMNLHDWVYIGTSREPSIQALNDSKAITHEEFQQAYEEVIKKLEDKLFVDIRYEFQIVEGSIYIDEIVNEKAGRQFKLDVVTKKSPDYIVIEIASESYENRHGEIDEDQIMIEEYAMFHRDKWEEVQP